MKCTRTRDVFLLWGFFPRIRFFVLAVLLPLFLQEFSAVVTQKPGDFTGLEQIFHFVACVILALVIVKIVHLTLAQLAEHWRTEASMAVYNRHPEEEKGAVIAPSNSPSLHLRETSSRGISFQNQFAGACS